MKLLFMSLFLVLAFHACGAQERYLLVSNGGGVAGTATVYKISSDGKVLKGKGLGEINYSEESKLKKCAARKYFKRAEKLMASSPDFNHPGNVYSSITLYEQGKENRIAWGDAEHAAPEDAKKLYQKISTRLTTLTFTPEEHK